MHLGKGITIVFKVRVFNCVEALEFLYVGLAVDDRYIDFFG